MAEHIDIGREGEERATEYLKRSGYKILARNVSNPLGKRLGELDIVASQGKTIVFVEVKTLRERLEAGEWLPEWNVTRSKLEKLERIAQYFLRREGLNDRDYRFDVIAVTLASGSEPRIKHIENAFL